MRTNVVGHQASVYEPFLRDGLHDLQHRRSRLVIDKVPDVVRSCFAV